MLDALFLVPLAIIFSAGALLAFMWSLSDGQYEDLEGASQRVLYDDRDDPNA